MTLSQRIAALTGPDRAIFIEAWEAVYGPMEDLTAPLSIGEQALDFLDLIDVGGWIDAALMLAAPAMQEHVMREALNLAGASFTVGKFTEQLARTICEVSMREKGL